MHIDQNKIKSFERRYRANFINSLGGFKSVVLVGTKSTKHHENLSVVSSLFHIGADPALCGFVIRPNEETENTLGNIVSGRRYTLNHIHEGIYRQAHQCSARYPAGESEFAATGLHPEYLPGFDAPFVAESHIKIGCELVQKTDIELNGTFLIIGKIVQVLLPDNSIQADGFVDLEHAGTMTCSGLDSYHHPQKGIRLSYAKTDQPIHEL